MVASHFLLNAPILHLDEIKTAKILLHICSNAGHFTPVPLHVKNTKDHSHFMRMHDESTKDYSQFVRRGAIKRICQR